MSDRIFVYGTLKRGKCNHHYLDGQRFIGEARTAPVYRLVDCGGYPGLISEENEGVSVLGEVWEVDADCRARLDVLEDVAHGVYGLEPVSLLAPFDKETVHTYVYHWPAMGNPDAGTEWKE